MSPGLDVSWWFGPLELRQYGENRWTFELATIEKTEGNKVTRLYPPSAALDPQYIYHMGRRQELVRASTHLVKPGEKVKLRLEGSTLVAEGLLVRVENQQWDVQGKPSKQNVVKLETKFVRAD